MTTDLSPSEIAFFRAQGYLKLSTVFEERRITDARSLVISACAMRAAPFKSDSRGRIVKLYDLATRNEVFWALFTDVRLLGALRKLLGPNIAFLRNRHNHASVIEAGMTQYRFHRDIRHWTRSNVTVLIYLNDADVGGGCTEIIPGSQHFELGYPPDNPAHGGMWIDELPQIEHMQRQSLPIPMRAGDVLLMDSLAFHTPGRSALTTPRIALTGSYRACDELAREENAHALIVSGRHQYCGNDVQW